MKQFFSIYPVRPCLQHEVGGVAHCDVVDARRQVQHLFSGRAELHPLTLQFVLHFVESLHHVVLFLRLGLTLPLLLLQFGKQLGVIYNQKSQRLSRGAGGAFGTLGDTQHTYLS